MGSTSLLSVQPERADRVQDPESRGQDRAYWERIMSDVFEGEVKALARRIGMEPTGIHVRPMRRKRATCSASPTASTWKRLSTSCSILRSLTTGICSRRC